MAALEHLDLVSFEEYCVSIQYSYAKRIQLLWTITINQLV